MVNGFADFVSASSSAGRGRQGAPRAGLWNKLKCERSQISSVIRERKGAGGHLNERTEPSRQSSNRHFWWRDLPFISLSLSLCSSLSNVIRTCSSRSEWNDKLLLKVELDSSQTSLALG